MSGKDEQSKNGKTGIWIGTSSVIFAIAVATFALKYEQREFEKFERFKKDVELQSRLNERLSAVERTANQIVEQDVFHRLDTSERKSNDAEQFTIDWQQSGELPVDREQNRKIKNLESSMGKYGKGLVEICLGLRDREPENKWPPCNEYMVE